jgi:hypothetical protein
MNYGTSATFRSLRLECVQQKGTTVSPYRIIRRSERGNIVRTALNGEPDVLS